MERERDELNAVVLNYLRRMGYRQTEQLFREEAHMTGMETLAFELRNEQDSNIANYLLFASGPLDNGAYESAYEALRKWIYDSLDAYRDELLPLSYPLYVHCILDMVGKGCTTEAKQFLEKFKGDHLAAHEDEITRLAALSDAAQLKENALAVAFRSNKYNIAMSAYSFQLLMNYLQEGAATSGGGGNILLLKIINQFINIRVLVSRPVSLGSATATGPIAGLTGMAAEMASNMNKGKIQWGANAIQPSVESALSQRSKSESRLAEVMLGPLAQLKRAYTQSSLNAPTDERIPKPTPTAADLNAEIDRLRHMAKRAGLSAANLASICFYTLHNAFESVTSIDFSPTSTMMATGNRDSYLDIWSLDHEPLRAIRPSTELAAMDLADFDSLEGMIRERDGSMTKRLIGHCGPVYSSKFLPPDGQRLLISASQDSTARLWSLDLFCCVTVYRGHNHPVWDVDVAPLGAGSYFVTASADRTARLWATEHIQPLRIFAGHLSDVDAVRFHPNGNYILTASSDKTCRMWDMQSGGCVRLLTGHTRAVSALAVSPDGRLLASGDRNGGIRLWDLAEGRLIKALQIKPLQRSPPNRAAPPSALYSIEFDRDGRVLATGGADQTVRLWDVSKLVGTPAASADVPDDIGLLAAYPTKQTPVMRLHFTYRNLLLAGGTFHPED